MNTPPVRPIDTNLACKGPIDLPRRHLADAQQQADAEFSAARALHIARRDDTPVTVHQFRLMNYGILSKSLYLGRDGLWQERAEQAVIFTSWTDAMNVGTCISGLGGSWRVETLETFKLPMPI